jgi:hypothetical protein
MQFNTLVGIQNLADGAQPIARSGRQADTIVSELHGRFYEQNYRGNLFSIGSAQTALSANTITLTATTTPIIGVWNPPNSPVNLVILQAGINLVGTGATAVGQGALVWAASIGNTAISTGSAPFSRKTLTNVGSQAKGFPFVALTGLTNNLVVFDSADFGGIGFTVTSNTSIGGGLAGVQNFDGNLIVPPGGLLALLNTTSTTTISAASRLLWEEVPL